MSTLLFIIIVCYLGVIVARWALPRLLHWYLQRKAQSYMNDIFGQRPSSQSGQQTRSRYGFGRRRQEQPKQHRRRGKIITKDVGEYVEFEEIQTYQAQTNPDTGRAQVKYTEESQITDVEWEDIK